MRRIVFITGYATISKEGQRFIFRNFEGKRGVPVRYVDMILVSGKVSITGDAVNLMLTEKIPLFFLTRFYRLRGALIGDLQGRRSSIRAKQFEAFRSRRVEIARDIVRRKVEAVKRAFSIELKEEKAQLEKAKSLTEVMGVEGSVSRKMFSRFRENIEGCGLTFRERTYNPPRDEVNALLSLSYTLSYCLALPVVLFVGLDPYISFLHTGRGSHLSLCSDIIEPVRPVVTKLLQDPIIREVFRPEDFSRNGSGFYLKKEAVSKFLNWFEGVKDEITREIRDSVLFLEERL